MDKYQNFVLKITKDVIGIFENNNINYFISSGTLLGAVRHKGFIPWDNDVDIMIPYEDYKKALRILKKELDINKYFIQNIKSEKKYNALWTKVRANGTTSLPEKHKRYDVHFGVGIDIFPVIGINDKKLFKKIQFSLLGLQRTLISVDFTKATDLKITGKYKYICATPRILRRCIARLLSLITMQKIGNKKIVQLSIQVFQRYGIHHTYLKKGCVLNLKQIPFTEQRIMMNT